MAEVKLADYPRRSFVHRKLAAAGASFVALGDAAIAADFGDAAAEAAMASQLGLTDLSVVPRGGFKGAGALDWLADRGWKLPQADNRAQRQGDGALLARLSPSEALILGALENGEAGLAALDEAWQADREAGGGPQGYPLPRRDSHAWFRLTGEKWPRTLAKLCAVDLRPARFPDGAVAQTQAARVNVILLRDDVADLLAFHLLVDSASAAYLWDCLLDAMAEFGGRPVGLSALKSLG
ncbi:MAG: hypothetical protein MI785_29380 [Kiloniellales bacterium]|nr:hypothetical protein [Kiloniellales bacterium]